MPGGFEKIGRVSNASVLKCTGKGWEQWVTLLNRAGAQHWSHGEITAFLKKKYRLSSWWQQGVACGYETFLGRRVEGRSSKGDWSLTATKSFPLSQKAAWKLLTSTKGISLWLQPLDAFAIRLGSSFETDQGIFGELRTMKAPQRLRLTWKETEWAKASTLQIHVVAGKNGKSIVVFSHGGLPEGRLRSTYRARWRAALERLVAAVKEV